MELKKLKRYYLRNDAIKELEIYHKNEIGLGIAMVKFEEFQKAFTYAQHSFYMGMQENHKVFAGDGNHFGFWRAPAQYIAQGFHHQVLWAGARHRRGLVADVGVRLVLRAVHIGARGGVAPFVADDAASVRVGAAEHGGVA